MPFRNHVVDERGERVAQQDCQHHSFRIAGVKETYGYAQDSYQESVYPFSGLRLRGSNGIRCHKYCSEGESAHHQMPVCGDVRYARRIGCNAHKKGSRNAGSHNLPACNARPYQDEGAQQDGNHAGFAHGAGNRSKEQVPEARAVLRAGAFKRGKAVARQRKRRGSRGRVYQGFAFAQGYPRAGSGHTGRI